jgi:hypothetical protein
MPHSQHRELDGLSLFDSESASAEPTISSSAAAGANVSPGSAACDPSAIGRNVAVTVPITVVAVESGDGDGLSYFESESGPIVAVSDCVPEVLPADQHRGRRDAGGFRWRLAAARWALPAAAAILLVAPSALVGWYALRTGVPVGRNSVPAPALPIMSATDANQVSAPTVREGIQAALPRALEDRAFAMPASPVVVNSSTPRRKPAAASQTFNPADARSPAPRGARAARESFTSGEAAQSTAGVEASVVTPIAPIHATRRTPSLDVIGADTTSAAAAPGPLEDAGAESAVRRALRSYQEAYGRLDVAGAADVWPTVDRRALSRAFDTLKSQGLDFQSCTVTVTGVRATARCRGTLQFVRKVGSPLALTADQEWVFTMRQIGGHWKIDHVLASQTAVVAAMPTGTQG